MDHYRKALREQMEILGMDQVCDEKLNLEFLRVHAVAIVQLCDEILLVQGCYSSGSSRSGAQRSA
jgi:hypothetical protein